MLLLKLSLFSLLLLAITKAEEHLTTFLHNHDRNLDTPNYTYTIIKDFRTDIIQVPDANTYLLSIQNNYYGKYILIEVVFKDSTTVKAARPLLSALSLEKKPLLFDQTFSTIYYDKTTSIVQEYMDFENYMDFSTSHYLLIDPQINGNAQKTKWEIQVKMTGDSTAPLRYSLSVTFSAMPPCPFSCHNNQGFCSNGIGCLCTDNFIGDDCNIEINKINAQFWYNKYIDPYSILYFYYELPAESYDLYIKLDGDDGNSNIFFTFNKDVITSIPNRATPGVYVYPLSFETVTILIKKQMIDKNKLDNMTTIAIGVENKGRVKINFKINIGPNTSTSTDEPESQIYLFAIVVCIILILLLISLTLLHKYRSRNIQLALNNRRQQNQAPPMDEEIIEKLLPTKTFREYESYAYEVKGEEGKQYCPICLVEFEIEDKCRLTPCYHLFHNECLSGWLKKNENCPFCRKELKRNFLEHSIFEPLLTREQRSHPVHEPSDEHSIPYQPPIIQTSERGRQLMENRNGSIVEVPQEINGIQINPPLLIERNRQLQEHDELTNLIEQDESNVRPGGKSKSFISEDANVKSNAIEIQKNIDPPKREESEVQIGELEKKDEEYHDPNIVLELNSDKTRSENN